MQYGTIPKVSVNLAVPAGNGDEKANEVWLARPDGRHAHAKAPPPGALRRSPRTRRGWAARSRSPSATNRIDIGGDVLSEFAPEMVALVADVAQHPKFPEAELERLKADRSRQLSIAKSQPQPLAQEKFRAVLYGDQPYGRVFPTEAMLQGYTIAQVKDFYGRNFGAARSRIYVVGRFDAATVEAAIRKAFAGWKRGPAPNTSKPKSSSRARGLPDRPAGRRAVDASTSGCRSSTRPTPTGTASSS